MQSYTLTNPGLKEKRFDVFGLSEAAGTNTSASAVPQRGNFGEKS